MGSVGRSRGTRAEGQARVPSQERPPERPGAVPGRDLRSANQPTFALIEKLRSWKFFPDDGSESRQLNNEEIATLAGFRPDYPFVGSRFRRALQAANAVAPPIAAALVDSMIRRPWDAQFRWPPAPPIPAS